MTSAAISREVSEMEIFVSLLFDGTSRVGFPKKIRRPFLG